MSHVKNVVGYSRLVDICTGYGGSYNPGRQTLQLNAMKALLKKAQSSLQDVTLKRHAYNHAVNDRAQAFTSLDTMTGQLIRTMGVLQIPKRTIEDARFFARLIKGKRATPRLPIPSEDSDAPTPSARSFTQLSYVARASNFAKLIQLIEGLPAYVAHEPELQVPALIKQAAYLNQQNEQVHKAKLALTQARQARDRILYLDKASLVTNGVAIKEYAKVAFGFNSGKAVQMRNVSFTKPRIK